MFFWELKQYIVSLITLTSILEGSLRTFIGLLIAVYKQQKQTATFCIQALPWCSQNSDLNCRSHDSCGAAEEGRDLGKEETTGQTKARLEVTINRVPIQVLSVIVTLGWHSLQVKFTHELSDACLIRTFIQMLIHLVMGCEQYCVLMQQKILLICKNSIFF